MCEVDPCGDEIVDQSPYTLEAQILAAAWWHESGKPKHDMKVVRERFNQKSGAKRRKNKGMGRQNILNGFQIG